MGVNTLDQFRDLLNLALGGKAQANERLDIWINQAIEELFVMLDIEGRRVCAQTLTIAAQERYLLPTNCVATLVLTDKTNKKRLIKSSVENYEKKDPTRSGKPSHYMRVDRHLHLFPIPDDEYLIHMFYIKAPTRMTTAADVTELTSAYDRVVHLLALRNALMDLRETEAATFFYQTAVNMLRMIPDESWLESQNPQEGISIARSESDLAR
ncbi:MAG: hypothetical protein AB7V18_19145 [Pyrinomonadaceae bacterium]